MRALRSSLRIPIGIRLVVVVALHDRAAAFYEHYGFQRFPTIPQRLFLPMAHVRQVFSDEAPT